MLRVRDLSSEHHRAVPAEMRVPRRSVESTVNLSQHESNISPSAIRPDFPGGWYEPRRAAFDAALAAHLAGLEPAVRPHTRLMDAVQYSLSAGGKRLRPLLVLESAAACGGCDAAALPAAIAIECVHAFSLIHDDLPAMDDDDLRRGMPTNHRVFGDALAILAGDWLLAHAFRVLGAGGDAAVTASWVWELSGGTSDMVIGQAIDIESEGRPADQELVRAIHGRKTSRLIEAACRMGAIAARANTETLAALGEFGRRLGLAFQIVDDLLDVTGVESAVGKRVGKDAVVEKQTYPAAFGVDASRVAAGREGAAALAALAPLGAAAERLREITRFVLARDR
jgi:geranylgeranyl diphosphate synthase type II